MAIDIQALIQLEEINKQKKALDEKTKDIEKILKFHKQIEMVRKEFEYAIMTEASHGRSKVTLRYFYDGLLALHMRECKTEKELNDIVVNTEWANAETLATNYVGNELEAQGIEVTSSFESSCHCIKISWENIKQNAPRKCYSFESETAKTYEEKYKQIKALNDKVSKILQGVISES